LTKTIAFSPRAEYYYDKDGFITGTAQKLREITLTGEYSGRKGCLRELNIAGTGLVRRGLSEAIT